MAISLLIEGPIGSGKTSVLDYLKNIEKSYIYVDEAISKFTRFETYEGIVINPLALMYSDLHNSCSFQNYLLDLYQSDLLELENKAKNDDVIIFDRCIISSHVFSRTIQKQNFFPEFSYHYWYKRLRTIMDQRQYSMPDQIYFIEIDVSTSLQRMSRRGRDIETDFKRMGEHQRLLIESFDEILALYQIPTQIAKSDTVEGRGQEILDLVAQMKKCKSNKA